jgi:hypothetical protein
MTQITLTHLIYKVLGINLKKGGGGGEGRGKGRNENIKIK